MQRFNQPLWIDLPSGSVSVSRVNPRRVLAAAASGAIIVAILAIIIFSDRKAVEHGSPRYRVRFRQIDALRIDSSHPRLHVLRLPGAAQVHHAR